MKYNLSFQGKQEKRAKMAQATGRLAENPANANYAFKRAVEAFENYYLLYYSPQNYMTDGKFKRIEVKIRDEKYSVTHRAGYFAN